jgi:ribosomal protein S18 acetylase RimI-like enzyme
MPEVAVEIANEATPEVVEAVARLLPQLSKSSPAPTAAELHELVTSPACDLIVARLDGRIVGCMTLVMFRIPTGIRAWIEDVVVDEAARGHGIGAAINRRAMELAASRGARTVDLTSRPSRVAANELYKKLGFVERTTNVYRWEPTGDGD